MRGSRLAAGMGIVLVAVLLAWFASSDALKVWYAHSRSTAELERAVKNDPQSPFPAYELGIRYARAGRLPEAIGLLERACQTDPNSAEAHFALGKAYALTNRPQDALTELQKAALLAPSNGQVFRFLGRELRLTGDVEGAKAAELKATNLTPKDAEAWYQLGVLYPSGAPDEADGRPYLKKAVELDGKNAVYVYAYGQSLTDGGQFSDAIPYLRVAVSQLSQDPSAHFLLGLALHRNGGRADIDAAEAELKRAVELNPNDFRAHFELANMLTERGSYAQALPVLETAARLNPTRPEIWSALRMASDRTGNKARAAEAQAQFDTLRKDHVEMEKLKSHLAQEPNDDAARERVGQLLEKVGNYRSAAIYYTAVIEHDPANSRVRARLAGIARFLAQNGAQGANGGPPR